MRHDKWTSVWLWSSLLQDSFMLMSSLTHCFHVWALSFNSIVITSWRKTQLIALLVRYFLRFEMYIIICFHFLLVPLEGYDLSHLTTKPTNWSLRLAKTQISLGISPVWLESSLSAWRHIGSLATHSALSEDSDQTGLIWVFDGCTCHFVGFVMRRLISDLGFYFASLLSSSSIFTRKQSIPLSWLIIGTLCITATAIFINLHFLYTIMILSFPTDRSGQTE